MTAPSTVNDLLDGHARERPHATALDLPAPGRAWTEPWLGRWSTRRMTFADLARRVTDAAAGLARAGLTPGMRTALLVPPNAEFFVLAYALLRVGAVPVVVDPGIGPRRVKDCLGEVAPQAFVGVPRAHLARRALGWCPQASLAVTAGPVAVPGTVSLRHLERTGSPAAPAPVSTGGPAAILFTSGSTGPPKGVEHTEAALLAQAAAVRDLYGLGPDEVNLATFAPFALFGPALGMTTVVPRMDPTRPARVVPARLVRAARRTGATTMFGSPAVLDRLGRGAPAGTRLPALRTIISAGAPVPRDVQRRVLALLDPEAQVHTPYGATEALPVATIGSDELFGLPDDGICVGRPVPGVDVTLVRPTDAAIPTLTPDVVVPDGEVGEVVVRGPVVRAGYAERPDATRAATVDWDGRPAHRTGDLASFDREGRLWFAGRVAHVVSTREGPRHSVPCEEVLNRDPAVRRSALVGVGPDGDRTPVLVVELVDGVRWDDDLRSRLLERAAAHPLTRGITTLLEHRGLPVDARHNSKIDRETVARWAAATLAPGGAR